MLDDMCGWFDTRLRGRTLNSNVPPEVVTWLSARGVHMVNGTIWNTQAFRPHSAGALARERPLERQRLRSR